MDKEIKTDPLMDHLVLQKIFSNFTLYELKPIRLVCRLWGAEGALTFRHKKVNIHLNPQHVTYESRLNGPKREMQIFDQPNEELYLKEMVSFLIKRKLKHTLHLSLLDLYPWLNNTKLILENFDSNGFSLLHPDFYKQGNNINFAQNIILNFIPKIVHLIKELRLEMMLKTKQDSQLLEQILEAIEQDVQRFSLDLIIFDDDLLKTFKPNSRKMSKITTLAIRLPLKRKFRIDDFWGEGLRLPQTAANNLLSLFPNVSFLDLVGWRQFQKEDEVENKTAKFLAAASNLNLKLEGFHANPITTEEIQSIWSYSYNHKQSLKFIYLNILFKTHCAILEVLKELLLNQAETLERINLIWRPLMPENHYRLELPPNGLPKLKSLSFSSKVKVEEDVVCCHENQNWLNAKLCDLFGLRKLFENSGTMLTHYFPSLESFSILFLGEGSEEMYNAIFPENLGFISDRVKTIIISYEGKCDAVEIEKFQQILFPKLRSFRHAKLREDGNLTFVCHHEYDERGELIGKWEWLSNVVHFMGQSAENRDQPINFYTALYRFKLNTGDHGFWDTPQDLERNGLKYI